MNAQDLIREAVAEVRTGTYPGSIEQQAFSSAVIVCNGMYRGMVDEVCKAVKIALTMQECQQPEFNKWTS